jgi:hypothetical protein
MMDRKSSEISVGLLLCFCLLIALSGCGSGDGKTVNTKVQSGKEGVSINFLTNVPPSIIYVGKDISQNEIPVELEVYNKGTSKTNVEIIYHGFDEKVISAEPEKVTFDQEDSYKTRYSPQGGYDTVSSKLSIRQMTSDSYTFPLKVTFCYNYDIRAGIPICVDPTPEAKIRGDSCVPSKVTTDGQGGPVGIDSIESEPMPGKVRLKIMIKDYSKAEIASPNTLNACQGEISRENLDFVKVTDIRLGDKQAESCNTVEDKIRLRNSVGELICTFIFTDDVSYSYKTIFDARLEYVVKDSTEKNIKIINEDYVKR